MDHIKFLPELEESNFQFVQNIFLFFKCCHLKDVKNSYCHFISRLKLISFMKDNNSRNPFFIKRKKKDNNNNNLSINGYISHFPFILNGIEKFIFCKLFEKWNLI